MNTSETWVNLKHHELFVNGYELQQAITWTNGDQI